ncbi:mandelate racemase/muconate lactonizing enzyme family protein [Frigidibacter sp. ROC022]|uniref:mandelate racemase/muconate lactonizing enzyme family protein n=1 Tax=Frigidibacter sp. ROC022 TaxID=2971796 RepID=UPI00215B48BD|nr:mandelate racemase/muconate lactonizing enzyme family protein [Frigidibacter sp. ROC022]MCR8725775.1 mandelate racemase/muconate lactonizing enzyme family protein [Frigidibacter sp. ROC022]
MRVEAVDFFYLSMPEVTTAADGSQDALLVRVAAGGHVGWGECEAAPLPSIAAFVCPMSHGACRPVSASVLGAQLNDPGDIAAISARVAHDSMDLLQAAHTLSGIEMALWDLLGKARDEPVWKLLGYTRSEPKIPYASLLFGDTPAETLERARKARSEGFRAMKFGWGPIGTGTAAYDAEHFDAAREGGGEDSHLMVDVGQIFGEDVEAAAARLPALVAARATWLEEPFSGHAFEAYAALGARSPTVGIAGGEAAHNVAMARHLMDFGRVKFIQIDCGRIGGIGPAHEVAQLAAARGVSYVNHTFTTHLALSASLQPFAGRAEDRICEYPADPCVLALRVAANPILRDAAGEIRAPEAPGLGITVDTEALQPYLVDTEIRVGGKLLYATPPLG